MGRGLSRMARMPGSGRVTHLLHAWGDGDAAALDELIPLVEAELRRMARRYMARERVNHTLQPTALVHEMFMRVTGARLVRWSDRAHFFGIAARLMRRVLVDHARARAFHKRGGDAVRVSFDERLLAAPTAAFDVLDLDRALEALALIDERKCRVIDMRFFAGMTVDETAEALGVSADTVRRDWRIAKMWLLAELKDRPRHD
jgi:RNA polymerase sigma-70 factor, ECF subfamily